jgi:predicted transcriptional regulator
LKLLKDIEKVTRKLAPGPAPSFNEAHVIKALEIIGDYRSVGRIRLSKELGLGEGTTRTLLKHLKSEGIILGSRRGISLSDEGKQLFSNLRDKLSEGVEIPSSRLTVGPFNVAVLVRDSAQAVKSGMEQRDVAIKSGASGATTLVYTHNKLSMPTREQDISESMPSLHNQLMTKFKPKENDVIIVGSGENRDLAEIGAKMAAIKLLKKQELDHYFSRKYARTPKNPSPPLF